MRTVTVICNSAESEYGLFLFFLLYIILYSNFTPHTKPAFMWAIISTGSSLQGLQQYTFKPPFLNNTSVCWSGEPTRGRLTIRAAPKAAATVTAGALVPVSQPVCPTSAQVGGWSFHYQGFFRATTKVLFWATHPILSTLNSDGGILSLSTPHHFECKQILYLSLPLSLPHHVSASVEHLALMLSGILLTREIWGALTRVPPAERGTL